MKVVNIQHYTYRVIWSEEDQEFIGLCSEFASLSFLALSQKEALEGIVELVSQVVEDMNNSNEDVPVPYSEKKYSGKFQVRITEENIAG